MTTSNDLDRVIMQYQLALDDLLRGNPEPALEFFSQHDDVSLANPISPIVCGRKQVEEIVRRGASTLRDGKHDSIETLVKMVTPDMAFFVWIERAKARFGDREILDSFALRVTVIFRPEDGTWKLVHRYADPIVSDRPLESVIQK